MTTQVEKEYELEFIGRARIKAFTPKEAMEKLKKEATIVTTEPIRYKAIWYNWLINIFQNSGAFTVTILLFILVSSYIQAINAFGTITDPSLKIIALLGLLIMIMVVPFKIGKFTHHIYKTFERATEEREQIEEMK